MSGRLASSPPDRERREAAVGARADADAAQARTGVRIRQLDSVPELRRASDLFQSIWGKSEDLGPPLNSDLLRAMAHAGNYVSGAFDGQGSLQGALVGFLGGPRDAIHLHSHILGVLPGSQLKGTGYALKLDQRAWSLEQGYETMEWTFDPLVRRNAYFNLTKLGTEVRSYLVNFYGAMQDGQNGDGDSDRLLVRWSLAAYDGAARQVLDERERAAAVSRLAVDPRGRPVAAASAGPVLLVQVPEDIVRMRVEAPDLAVAWRLAVRDTMVEAFDAGYRCAGVTRDGEYIFRAG